MHCENWNMQLFSEYCGAFVQEHCKIIVAAKTLHRILMSIICKGLPILSDNLFVLLIMLAIVQIS